MLYESIHRMNTSFGTGDGTMQTNKTSAHDNRKTNHEDTAGVPAWVGLHPVGVVTQGTPTQPIEQMMDAQSGVYRFIVMLEQIRLPKPAPSIRGLFATGLSKLVRG
jgi:hypothetical protein